MECLIHYDGISIVVSVASGQGTNFTASDVVQWAHFYGIHWSSMFSIILKQVA